MQLPVVWLYILSRLSLWLACHKIHVYVQAIHKRVGRGVTAHAGPTHMVPILVRRPSSVGRLPVI